MTDATLKRKGKAAPAAAGAAKKAKPPAEEAMDVDCPPGRPARAAAAKAAAAGTREAAEEEAHAPRSVVPKPAPAAVSEADALAATLGPGEAAAAAGAAYRRLSDFSVCDDAGRPQPLAPSPPPLPFPLLLSGRVLPAAGGAAKGAASSVERLSLASVSFDDATGVVLLSTSAATYTAVKPCAAYKPFFAPATECAAVCGAVMRALSEPSAAPTLEFKEAAARVARSQSITLPAARAMLVAAGPTLLAKMREADARLPAPDRKGKSKAGSAAVLRLCDAPFAVGLREALAEAAREAAAAAAPRAHGAGGIVIRDVAAQPAAPAAPAAAAAADAAAAVPATDESADRAAQAASDAAVAATLAATEASKAGSKARKADAAAAAKAASGSALVAADPSLWVHEHPGPTPYEKHTEEVDELLLGDMDGDAYVSPEDLPRRTLDDFALYTDEGMLASLELLPLWAGVDPDVDLFGSGVVGEDAGDWGDGSEQAEPSGGGAAGGGGSSSDAGGAGGGLRLFLSAVKEWVLECSFDAFSITLRTDAAWYRLKSPSQAYAPFYAPLRKACGVAVACLTMVAGEERAARMTLELLVRKLAELPPSSPLFISSKPAEVERYVASHGAIVLNQFATYPNKEVRKSPLPSQLRACMLSRRHTVAAPAAAGAGGGGKRGGRGKARGAAGERTNLNPVRSVAARAKPMRATQTSLVHRVWAATVAAAEDEARDAAAAAEAAEGAAAAAEEGAAPPDAAALRATAAATAAAGAAAAAVARKPPPLAARAPPPSSASSASAAASAASSKPSWPPGSLGTPLPAGSGVTHPCLLLGGVRVAPGDAVWINDDDASPSAPLLPGAPRPGARLGLVMRLWAPTAPGGHPPPHAAVRLLVHGAETVLRGAAGPSELFLSTRVVAGEVAATLGMVTASPGCEVARRDRPWGFAHRAAAEAEDAAAADAAAAAATLASADAAAAAAPVRYFWRTVWHPSRGAFLTPPPDILCYAAHEAAVATEAAARETRKAPSTGGFFKNGVEYAPGDYVYLLPEAVAPIEPLEASASPEAPAYLKAGRAQKGADQRCRALAVARIVAVSSAPAPAVAPPPPPQAKQSGGGAGAGAGAAAAAAGKKAPGRAAAAAAAAASRATAGDGDGGGASDGEEEEPDWDADDADDAATEEEEGDEGRRRRRAPSRKAAPATAARGRAASASGASFSLRLLRCVRPEELSAAMGYSAGQWEVYASSREIFAPVSAVVGKCCLVAPPESGTNTPLHPADTFICGGTWDFATSSLGPAPPGLAAYTPPPPLDASVKPLPTMDIFAGCGGLSEGMSQAGAAVAKWAIEYEPDAAQAFRDNHPGAAVFNANCNVILRAAMRKAGLPDACVVASPEAEEQAAAVPPDQMALIPVPGEVEFICGGPPCQGFSGMNRFTAKGSLWSKVQNEMILAYLSYADVYRPRYFLLENVRNFVSFNKGLTFRTALRTLLELGYQVRFGVLNAAFYGVGQSRKRAFLLAAAPGEAMPEWPLPVTCFDSPQLTFSFPCGAHFCAVPQRKAAPLRAVTVRDVIGDLPAVANGATDGSRPYGATPAAPSAPVSAFQKAIRGACPVLTHHVCKVLNELNARRCALIPRESAHDWRFLRVLVENGQQEAVFTPSGAGAKPSPLVPACLPNTESRHNGWRGLYSRLHWEGHFPTSVTDPNPMGKVGQVFHPNQDRIVSVRECARSQGFPDSFTFSGNVGAMHRQVGNAVPPPLANALGRELRKAMEATAKAKGAGGGGAAQASK